MCFCPLERKSQFILDQHRLYGLMKKLSLKHVATPQGFSDVGTQGVLVEAPKVQSNQRLLICTQVL